MPNLITPSPKSTATDLADELYVQDELDKWEESAQMIREVREAEEEERCARLRARKTVTK
jgi:hypothetical protein